MLSPLPLQDKPEDVVADMLVTFTSKHGLAICMKCIYIKRGSFKACGVQQLVDGFASNQNLKDKTLRID